jgi:hypothetical protein
LLIVLDNHSVKILLVLTLLNNFISLDILDIRYNKDGSEAISAKIGLYFEKGIIFQDLERRDEIFEKYSKQN